MSIRKKRIEKEIKLIEEDDDLLNDDLLNITYEFDENNSIF